MATGLHVRVEGVAQAQAELDRAQGAELARRVRQAKRAALAVLVQPIRTSITGSGLHSRTGRLMRSVSVKEARGSVTSVGPRTYYGAFLIHGTSRGIRSHPFVDQAYEAHADEVKERFTDVVWRGKR